MFTNIVTVKCVYVCGGNVWGGVIVNNVISEWYGYITDIFIYYKSSIIPNIYMRNLTLCYQKYLYVSFDQLLSQISICVIRLSVITNVYMRHLIIPYHKYHMRHLIICYHKYLYSSFDHPLSRFVIWLIFF